MSESHLTCHRCGQTIYDHIEPVYRAIFQRATPNGEDGNHEIQTCRAIFCQGCFQTTYHTLMNLPAPESVESIARPKRRKDVRRHNRRLF